jgi:spermidine/putrescine transport system ATP-binding protein
MRPRRPVLSDDLSQGHSQGTIVSSVWLGDHYQYIVRTDDEEDFIANTPYQWNEGDIVSVDIPVAAPSPFKEGPGPICR